MDAIPQEPNLPNDVSAVADSIPSAVPMQSTRQTIALLGLGVLAVLFAFCMRGCQSKPAPISPTETLSPIETTPTLTPMYSDEIRAALSKEPVAPAPVSVEPALREMRRTSPILILNNPIKPAGQEAALGASSSNGLPMPAGFQPTRASESHATAMGNRDFILAQGKMLDAVLETAVNTDHPGMIRGLITRDIYGDAGRFVLLPKGSRLIGQYDAAVAQGQNRVFVIWQRAIRPDGIDITLDSGGTDPLGQAGVGGSVHRHFFTMFGAATLLSMIGAASATLGVASGDNANSLSTYRSSIAQGFEEASNSVLSVFVRIKPTIMVRPGAPIKVFVARDLVFDPSLLTSNRVQVIP